LSTHQIQKIEAGHFELVYAPLSLRHLVRSCVRQMTPWALQQHVALAVEMVDTVGGTAAVEEDARLLLTEASGGSSSSGDRKPVLAAASVADGEGNIANSIQQPTKNVDEEETREMDRPAPNARGGVMPRGHSVAADQNTPSFPIVLGDLYRLQQVVNNFLSESFPDL
jgi:signal transduction histidine kinase